MQVFLKWLAGAQPRSVFGQESAERDEQRQIPTHELPVARNSVYIISSLSLSYDSRIRLSAPARSLQVHYTKSIYMQEMMQAMSILVQA
jgi:hypothetical protein